MTTGDPLRARLRALAAGAPELAGAASVYAAVLPLVRDAGPEAGPLALSRTEAEARLARGEILLSGGMPPFDAAAAGRLLSRLADSLAANGSPGAAPLALLLSGGRFSPGPVLLAVARGDAAAVAEEAHRSGLPSEPLVSLARYAVRPAFRRWGADAMALIPDGPRWESGSCWVCGDPALLAELLGPAQARKLRCGRCGASWGYPRLACVHCGSEDRSASGVLLPEGGPGTTRIETCDACRGYLKAVVSHDPAPADLLAVIDLETLSLDFLARARGYERYPL